MGMCVRGHVRARALACVRAYVRACVWDGRAGDHLELPSALV